LAHLPLREGENRQCVSGSRITGTRLGVSAGSPLLGGGDGRSPEGVEAHTGGDGPSPQEVASLAKWRIEKSNACRYGFQKSFCQEISASLLTHPVEQKLNFRLPKSGFHLSISPPKLSIPAPDYIIQREK